MTVWRMRWADRRSVARRGEVMSGREDGGRTCGEIEVDERKLLLPASVLPRVSAFPWQPATEREVIARCENSRVHAHFDVRHRERACGWRLVQLVQRRGHGDGENEAHEARREESRDVADAGVETVHGGGGGGEQGRATVERGRRTATRRRRTVPSPLAPVPAMLIAVCAFPNWDTRPPAPG